MLTKMSIEGYKPFGKKQTFRLAPITLVYGPNSGGKSSLLEAIQILLASHEKGMVVPGLDHVGPSANLLHSSEDGDRYSKAAIGGMLSREQGRIWDLLEGAQNYTVVDVVGLVNRTPISRGMGFVSDEPQYDQSGNLVPEEPSGEFYLDRLLVFVQAFFDQRLGQGVPPWLVEKHYLDPAQTIEITEENCEAYGYEPEEVWRDGPNPRLSFHDGQDGDGPPHTRVNPENGYWECCKEIQRNHGTQKTLRLIDDELLWEIITKTAPYSDFITPHLVEGVVKDIVSHLRFDIHAHQYCWDGAPDPSTVELLDLAKKYCDVAWWMPAWTNQHNDHDFSGSKAHAADELPETIFHPYSLSYIPLPDVNSYTFPDPPDSCATEFSSLRAKLESVTRSSHGGWEDPEEKEAVLSHVKREDPEADAFMHWLTTVLPLNPRCRTFPVTSGGADIGGAVIGGGALTVVPALRPEPVTWWENSKYPYHDVDEESVSACFSMLGLEYKFLSKDSHHDDIGPGNSAILVDRQGREINLRHTGTGISQVLPVVAALASNKDMVLLKQPELHLHPRQQGDLADVLIWSVRRSSALMHKKSISASNANLPEDSESAAHSEWTEKEISKFTPAWGNQVIAETHSEMLIYRLQRRIREGTLSPQEVSILYVEPMDDGASVVRELRLRPDGTFIDEWPGGFFEDDFDEFFGESPDAHGVNESLSEGEGD